MSIFTSIEQPFEAIWDGIKHVFHDDVEPVLRQFFEQFAGDDGRLILTDGIAATASLAAGQPFAAVATALVTDLLARSQALAAQDAGKTLLQIQSALQIGKATQYVLTASDQSAVAAIQAAAPSSPAASA